ncbi:MAG: phosphatase PAP2 family protein [Nanoarchaeota archaeon]|nr:phosphatase PAP2 family protein [Nanoarchaeota archaeon]
MKRTNDTLILIVGILLFLVSYKFDNQVNLLFKGMRLQFFDAVLSITTNFGVVIIVMLIIPSIILYKRNKKLIYLIWSTFVISFVLAFVIKLIMLRQRPIEAFTYPFTHIINYSFPSMHAMVAFSLLPILTKYMPKQRFFWIIFVFLAAFGRIYFGFHFLSDVVFGALSGYFIGSYLLDLHGKGKLWK